jgi:hypothetical protein
MSSLAPIDVVQSFIGEWPKGLAPFKQSLAGWLAGYIRYENVDLTNTTTVRMRSPWSIRSRRVWTTSLPPAEAG